MKIIDKTLLLFIIIVLEGYAVLSCEMLAIRQTIPFVGSGTDTVSIIIAAVLMPLAVGYYAGGQFRGNIRKKLIFNILIAQGILAFGLSYYPLTTFFYTLIDSGIKHRLVLTTLYSLIFLVTPVYLLGQTIPLVSNYFPKEKLSRITGRMLFLSTLGSFLGAVFTTLILMAFIGVHYTVALLSLVLTALVVLLSGKKYRDHVLCSLVLCGFTFAANSAFVMRAFHIVEDNQYNTITIYSDEAGARHMALNHTESSMYGDDGRKHTYVEFTERQTLDPIRTGDKPKDILVIGAGGFTFGFEDHFNNYDFVDIDKSLKEISEKYILKAPLTKNKHFIPMEVRAYFMSTDKKYDVIFLDAYNGDLSLPEHLVTRDFFAQVRDHLKERGIVAANFVVSPNFESPFSRNVDNTFRSVFPHISRHVIDEKYRPWNDNANIVANVIYLYRQRSDENPGKIYTDDKNTMFYDKPQVRN